MAGEIIRLGDPTSHGGKVIEGSPLDICHGKPIAYLGHKTFCPKCKGMFPIVDGAPTTTFYGKGVALAGMKTACGAVLIATQFTDVVEIGGGSQSGASQAESRQSKSLLTNPTARRPELPTQSNDGIAHADFEQYFEAVDSSGASVELIYRINSGKIKLAESAFSGNVTQAFPVDMETALIFWKAQ
jgi:uncharacterized Zn-binding protein involved in type VI secretion